MKDFRIWALAFLIVAAPAMTSCWPFRRSKPATPPAPAPAQTQPQTAPPQPVGQPDQPQPVAQQPPLPPAEPPKQPEDTGVVSLPAPQQKRPSPAGPRVETPPQAEPAPAPQLKQILTPQQQQQLNQIVDERIRRARQVLASLAGRKLTQPQLDAVNHIRTFISQAEEARKTDLIRARNLAERADVLARDLINSLP